MWQDLFKKVVVSNRLARKQIEMARALEFNRAWAEAETLSKRIPESKEPRMWQWRNVNRQREIRGKSWGGEGGDPVDEMPGGVGEGREVKTMNWEETRKGHGSAMFIREN